MYITLEFNKVLSMLEDHALSINAKTRIQKLEPFLSESEVHRHLNETSEAREIIEHYGTPPLSPMSDLEKSLSMIGKGTILMPEELTNIAQFITSCRRLKSYLHKAEALSTSVATYGNSIFDLSDIEDEINNAIRGNQINDKATPALADIRRKISNAGASIKSKLESLLKNNNSWFSESFVSIRNGHYTLPVKKEYKGQVSGTVIDISQSGSTYFIEPTSARRFQEELSLLMIEEENEVRRILYILTALVEDNLQAIRINIEAMECLDYIFAKAKLSIAMKAIAVPISTERKIEIINGRHPLLNAENIVPLNFKIGGEINGVVITGPNTGGKTVALKTIGLLSIMAQSGLHVPVEGGCLTMNNYVLADIGDGQSISENLSTFSSHMTNIIGILTITDDQSLVLLDELGSGTDPAEGMGLAVAIIEELVQRSCLFVATTHYPEIKELAKCTMGLVNARMAFDLQSLMPLYKLEIGEAGESCALYIAKRLGLPQEIIDRAGIAAYSNSAQTGGATNCSISAHSGGNATDSSINTESSSTTAGTCSPAPSSISAHSGGNATPRTINTGRISTTSCTCSPVHVHDATGDINSITTAGTCSPAHAHNTTDSSTTAGTCNAAHAHNTTDGCITAGTCNAAHAHNTTDGSTTTGTGPSNGERRIKPKQASPLGVTAKSSKYNIGDSVMVYPQKMIGIVFQTVNERGEIGVQIKGKKVMISHKRLKLHVSATELYPDDYDFSIVFESVENRKKRHSMERKHDPNIIVET